MFQTKIVEKMKTKIFCSVTFSRKPYRLWDNVAKSYRTLQATDKNMAKGVACWIPNATNPHSEHVLLAAFPVQQWSHGRPYIAACSVTDMGVFTARSDLSLYACDSCNMAHKVFSVCGNGDASPCISRPRQ
jgi:hypothetical protein